MTSNAISARGGGMSVGVAPLQQMVKQTLQDFQRIGIPRA